MLAIAALTQSLLLAAPAGATLVVAPLERVQTRKSDATTLTEMIRIQVGQSARFTLVTPEEQRHIDEELRRQLSGGCSEASCIAELGGALGARFLITGKFSRFGSRYVLLLKLIDIELGKAVNTASLQAGALEMLLDDLPAAVGQLIGERPAEPAPRAAAPSRPQIRGSAIRQAFGWVNMMVKPRHTQVSIQGRKRWTWRSDGLKPRTEQLPPGRYRWQAVREGFETQKGTFQVRADQTSSLNITLLPPGHLVVEGTPKGSKVEVSGRIRTVQGLPMAIRSAPSGTYHLTISNPGYYSQRLSKRVRAGQTTRVRVQLKPDRRRRAKPAPKRYRSKAERVNENVSFLYGTLRSLNFGDDEHAVQPMLWFQPEGLPGMNLPAVHVGVAAQIGSDQQLIRNEQGEPIATWMLGYEHYFASADEFSSLSVFGRLTLNHDPGFEAGASIYLIPFEEHDMGATTKVSTFIGASERLGPYAGVSGSISWAGATGLSLIVLGALLGG